MKKLFIVVTILFALLSQIQAQSPVYYFSQSLDTAIESNAYVIAGYVKTDTASVVADSVLIILRSGSPWPTHMDTASTYVVNFNAGQDSVPFLLHITKDTFPERPEHVLYTLNNPVNGSSIGIDSSLLFILIDTTPRAIISYTSDSGWAYLHAGTYTVCETINNPNLFWIRFHTTTHDAWYGYPGQSAYGGVDYFYDWDTVYAPPGLSSSCETITIVPDTFTTPPSKTFQCVIQNVFDDDNIITNSFEFTIVNDNEYDSPTVSFGASSLMVQPDTTIRIGIPLREYNPNHLPFTFTVDTGPFISNFFFDTLAFSHFSFTNNSFTVNPGFGTDTLWLLVNKSSIISDTADISLIINTVRLNKSGDTTFHLIITNPDTIPLVSFYGAGLAHLKSDSIGYVQVYTNSALKFPVSVKVSYLNGNAKRDTDFVFNDTTITFPPFTFDTISVPVIMLQDHLYQGNTQVNLKLSNVSPASVGYGITQYTFTIIDDEDSGLTPLAIRQTSKDQIIKVHPNPFDNEITIETALPQYSISITNTLGENIYSHDGQNGNMTISFADRPSGLYLVRISNGDRTYVTKILKL